VLLGLDIGTSAVKGIALDPSTGVVTAVAERPLALDTPEPRHAEQDPEAYANAAFGVLAELASRVEPGAVMALGLTGQMHSAVLLGAEHQPLRPAILWCDTRTTDECREITAALGLEGLRRAVGNLALEGFTLPKLLWVRRHEPELFARARAVLMPKDFVGLRLTGALGTEVSDASGTLLFDPRARRWSQEVLGAFGLDPALLPPVDESPTRLGGLTARAARATGLPAGLPVVRGAADNAAGAVGLGVVREGTGMLSLGTSGVVLCPTDALRVEPAMRLHSFCAAVPGRNYLMGVMLSAGGALRWFRDTVLHEPYEALTARAAKVAPGAGGALFLPYLLGERTPHNDSAARGAFLGLSAATGPDALARAVLEGISYGLRDCLDLLGALDPPVRVGALRITGGGARSAFWRQLLADILGVQVVLTSATEGPSLGAALLAGAAVGCFSSVEAACEATVRPETVLSPQDALRDLYAERHAAWRALYPALKGALR
jgi:xylulokinase